LWSKESPESGKGEGCSAIINMGFDCIEAGRAYNSRLNAQEEAGKSGTEIHGSSWDIKRAFDTVPK